MLFLNVKYFPRCFGSVSPSEYLMTLLRPIAELFNQLHSPRVLKMPVKCISIDFDFGECGSLVRRFFVPRTYIQ